MCTVTRWGRVQWYEGHHMSREKEGWSVRAETDKCHRSEVYLQHVPIAPRACCSSKVKFSMGTDVEAGTTATVARLVTMAGFSKLASETSNLHHCTPHSHIYSQHLDTCPHPHHCCSTVLYWCVPLWHCNLLPNPTTADEQVLSRSDMILSSYPHPHWQTWPVQKWYHIVFLRPPPPPPHTFYIMAVQIWNFTLHLSFHQGTGRSRSEYFTLLLTPSSTMDCQPYIYSFIQLFIPLSTWTVLELETWNCILIQPAPPHPTDVCALSQSTKRETVYWFSQPHPTPLMCVHCPRVQNVKLCTDSASPTPPHWCVCTVPEYKTWNCMLIQPAPPHSTDECALSQSTKHETGYSFLPVLLLMAIDCPRATVLRFCRLPRILWPSKWMRRVTTWGYLTLIKVKSSSGILASSVSLKAVNRIFVRKKWQRVVTEMKL